VRFEKAGRSSKAKTITLAEQKAAGPGAGLLGLCSTLVDPKFNQFLNIVLVY
jgi:hypothetical protein